MNYPKLFQFSKSADIAIIKYLAYLKKKARSERLTPQEQDMLTETMYHHELCQVLQTSHFLSPWFVERFTMRLNLYDYVTELVHQTEVTIPMELIPDAVNSLLEEAYAKLFEPQYGCFTCLLKTPCGDVVKVYDCSKHVGMYELDKVYAGFSALFLFELQRGLSDEEALSVIKSLVRDYYIDDSDNWIQNESFTNYSFLKDFIFQEANRILHQLKERLFIMDGQNTGR